MAEAKPISRGRRQTATAAAGGSVGVLVVWILSLFDVPVTPGAAAVLGVMVTTMATALGSEGIKGIVQHVWRGVNGDNGNGDKVG